MSDSDSESGYESSDSSIDYTIYAWNDDDPGIFSDNCSECDHLADHWTTPWELAERDWTEDPPPALQELEPGENWLTLLAEKCNTYQKCCAYLNTHWLEAHPAFKAWKVVMLLMEIVIVFNYPGYGCTFQKLNGIQVSQIKQIKNPQGDETWDLTPFHRLAHRRQATFK